ncbi:MAG: class I SAM-dependent methyltransferase [Bacillota bacterium]
MSPCPICQSETYPLEDPEINVTHHVCKGCGYTFKDKAAHVDSVQEKNLYSNHQNTLENKGYVAMFERFLAFALDERTAFGPALDFGSGPGPVLYELLKRRGFESYHYDPYFHHDDSVFNRSYGFITSTEVFEHLSTPRDTFHKLETLLKPQGMLAVMTSLRPDDDAAFLTWWYRRDPTHIGFFTEKAMRELSKDSTMTLVKSNQKNHFLFKKILEA